MIRFGVPKEKIECFAFYSLLAFAKQVLHGLLQIKSPLCGHLLSSFADRERFVTL
jgi:hypothetical protein